jgi:hypothetical protein
MPATKTFTVDAIGDDEPVTSESNCQRITIFENAQAGAADYTVRRHSRTATAVTIPAGAKFVFEGPFLKGVVVGYVAAASGSFTMAQVED